MKIKDGFILREVADTWVVVPLGKRVAQFNGLIRLSETGAFLWLNIDQGKEKAALTDLLINEYRIDRETAAADIDAFISDLYQKNLLEEAG